MKKVIVKVNSTKELGVLTDNSILNGRRTFETDPPRKYNSVFTERGGDYSVQKQDLEFVSSEDFDGTYEELKKSIKINF